MMLFSSVAVFAQSKDILAGTVLQPNGKKVVPGTVVTHLRDGKSILANEQGRFLIKAATGDSVMFRAIGYKPLLYVRSAGLKQGELIQIVLQLDTVMLREVEVIALPSLRELQQVKYEPRSNVKNPGYIPPPEPKPILPTPTAGSPIGALYNVLSKEAKELKKLKKLHIQQKADEQEKAREEYNKFFKDSKGFQ